MASVYIETSIIGYLTSQLVIDEAGAGDSDAAAERLALLTGIPLLASSDSQVDLLADALLAAHLLPEKARSDAEHVAIATVHRINYLLTWNCKLYQRVERRNAPKPLAVLLRIPRFLRRPGNSRRGPSESGHQGPSRLATR